MKLIENWRKAPAFLSVIAAGVGTVAYTVVQIAQDVQSLGLPLPAGVDNIVVYATLAAVVAGRLIKQDQ